MRWREAGGRPEPHSRGVPEGVSRVRPPRIILDEIGAFEGVHALLCVDPSDPELAEKQGHTAGLLRGTNRDFLVGEGFAQEITLVVPVEIAAGFDLAQLTAFGVFPLCDDV